MEILSRQNAFDRLFLVFPVCIWLPFFKYLSQNEVLWPDISDLYQNIILKWNSIANSNDYQEEIPKMKTFHRQNFKLTFSESGVSKRWNYFWFRVDTAFSWGYFESSIVVLCGHETVFSKKLSYFLIGRGIKCFHLVLLFLKAWLEILSFLTEKSFSKLDFLEDGTLISLFRNGIANRTIIWRKCLEISLFFRGRWDSLIFAAILNFEFSVGTLFTIFRACAD